MAGQLSFCQVEGIRMGFKFLRRSYGKHLSRSKNIYIFFLVSCLFIFTCGKGCSLSGTRDDGSGEWQVLMGDAWPEGCNSCHRAEDKDRTIATYTNQRIQGHPVIDSRYLKECMECHRSGEQRFQRRLHQSHLQSRIFIELMNSNCQGCHQMNQQGDIYVKDLE